MRVPGQFGMAALQRYDVEERRETWKQYEAMVGVGESGFSSGARGTSWHILAHPGTVKRNVWHSVLELQGKMPTRKRLRRIP